MAAGIEAARPTPRVFIVRNAGADGDRAGVDVAIIDVPAVLAFWVAAAGEGGHGAIEAPARCQNNTATDGACGQPGHRTDPGAVPPGASVVCPPLAESWGQRR